MILEETGLGENDFSSPSNMRSIIDLYGFIGFKITISDIYKGSTYDNTCISEITVSLEDF